MLDQPAAAVIEPVRMPRKSHRYSLIFSAVALLVMATIGFRYRQQKRQQYPLIAERGRTEGIPALDEGKFDRAYQLLSAAKSAVDSLGGDIEGADEIREAAEEAAIFIDLSSQTLEQMLKEAGRKPRRLADSVRQSLQETMDHHRLLDRQCAGTRQGCL